jgi:anaerobic selenocysteine-containing dehydrogenase
MLRGCDIVPDAGADAGRDAGAGEALRVAWDAEAAKPVLYDPASGAYDGTSSKLALTGRYEIAGADGTTISCRPAFELYAERCRSFTPERVEAITWIPAEQLRAAARLIAEAGAVSCYSWSGVSQQDNASQTSRAIALLYALTGSFDAPGGNVLFETIPVADIAGAELLPPEQMAKAVGGADRPLGPERNGWITTDNLYRAILEGTPYPIKGMVSFGTNILVSHADPARGLAALKALDFAVHIDMFMTPSAALADIVLPVNTPWEREGLRTNFGVGQDAASFAQLRPPVIESRGESKSDIWIAFELAKRLGLAEQFWGGDIDASYRARLAPSGLSLEELRQNPSGIQVPLKTRYRKYAGDGGDGSIGPGFATPSRKVEIFSERFQAAGQAPLPDYVEPAVGPVSRPDLAADFPLVLTSAKSLHYCHSQHRGLPSLRKREPDPVIEMHPIAAAERRIEDGDWIRLATPDGAIRARAKLRNTLDPRVVSATYGWWQACTALGLPGYDATGPDSANINDAIGNRAIDPISGSVPHRSYLCEVSRMDAQ